MLSPHRAADLLRGFSDDLDERGERESEHLIALQILTSERGLRVKAIALRAASSRRRTRIWSSGGIELGGLVTDFVLEVGAQVVDRPELHLAAHQLLELQLELSDAKQTRDTVRLSLDE